MEKEKNRKKYKKIPLGEMKIEQILKIKIKNLILIFINLKTKYNLKIHKILLEIQLTS